MQPNCLMEVTIIGYSNNTIYSIIFQVFIAHLTCEISMNFSHLDTLFQATDGRLLFGALIDVYDNSTGEKQ